MLLRLRITEVGEDAVAHVLCDVASEHGDRLSHSGVIGSEDLSQIFRIEAGR
jgi:hypothetical protein